MTTKVIGLVKAISHSSDQPPEVADVVVDWMISRFEPGGPAGGQDVVRVDIEQSDGQIKQDIRTELALKVNGLFTPNLLFAAADVRGCEI